MHEIMRPFSPGKALTTVSTVCRHTPLFRYCFCSCASRTRGKGQLGLFWSQLRPTQQWTTSCASLPLLSPRMRQVGCLLFKNRLKYKSKVASHMNLYVRKALSVKHWKHSLQACRQYTINNCVCYAAPGTECELTSQVPDFTGPEASKQNRGMLLRVGEPKSVSKDLQEYCLEAIKGGHASPRTGV